MHPKDSIRREIRVRVGWQSDPGRVRETNEDGCLVVDALTGSEIARKHAVDAWEHPVLLAVSDGMGGQNAGEVASTLCLAFLRDVLVRRLPIDRPEDALRTAVEVANEIVTDSAKNHPTSSGMGATLVAALVVGDAAYLASVGDSRIYLLRHGTMVQLTKDQTYLQAVIDNGMLSPEDIARFPHKSILLKAIGHASDLNANVVRVDLRRDDILLLCSDGLTGELDDRRIVEVLSRQEVDSAPYVLIAETNEHGGKDNVTVVVAKVFGTGLEPDT